MNNKNKTKNYKQIDTIIFNLDGTLINSTQSYRRAIEVTVNNYLKGEYVTQNEINIIKGVLGYNNDWDTATALIMLIQQKIPKSAWGKTAHTYLPINRKSQLFKEIYNIFQTCFLGSKLYKELEQGTPPFPYNPGLITYQKSIVKKELIHKLKKSNYKIAIVTECPRAEVKIMLEAEGLYGKDYFEENNIIGQEDTKETNSYQERLLKAQEKMASKRPVYIGDTITDVEAAKNANMPCIYVGNQNNQSDDNYIINEILELFTK